MAPDSVQAPVPSFVTELVEAIGPEMEPLPAPPRVRAKVEPVIPVPAVSESVPASELIRLAEPRVTVPCQVLLPLMLRRAPSVEKPVPFKVRASAPTVIPPCSWSAAPEVTEVPAAVPPRAELLWIFKTPAVTEVTPA